MSYIHSPWRPLASLPLLVAIFILILDAQTAAQAAATGITMCLQIVIPSLFPFFVLSRLFVRSAASEGLVRLCGPVMGPLFGLPGDAAPALVLGLVGGYPVGAKTAAELYTQGRLTRGEAEHLLSFCSNAGPAFLFGMVGGALGSSRIAAMVFAIHAVSALLAGFFLSRGRKGGERPSAAPIQAGPASLTGAVSSATGAMAAVCAYVVLFSVVSAFVRKWLPVTTPIWLQVAICGLLELSGGVCRLVEVLQPELRLLLAVLFPTFGGLCVYLQTLAVIRPAGLTGYRYLAGKLLQSALATAITLLLLSQWPQALPTAAAASTPSNHTGLLRSVGIVAAACTGSLGIWCAVLQKKAGKAERMEV